jgi:hypothetical protein
MQFFDRAKNSLHRKWVHYQNDRRIVQMAREVSQNAPDYTDAQRVVMFNASTRLGGLSLNAAFSLLAGWSLRLEGAKVTYFVCQAGLSRCVLGTERDHPQKQPPCAECMRQSRAVYAHSDVRPLEPRRYPELEAQLADLSLSNLEEFTYQTTPLGQLVLPSLRWILRRHHLTDNDSNRFLYRKYILSAWNVIQQFGSVLDEVQPEVVVVFNGMFYPEAAARWTARQRGIRVITQEVGLQPFSAYFTPGEATAYPIDIPEEFELNAVQTSRLDSYLEQRFQGNFTMAGVRFWPEMVNLGLDFWQRASNFQQVVPVFTNVIFDTSQGHANVIYPHMFAWLDSVLELIHSHPETFFVIRAHPDESRPGKESLETVSNWVHKHQVELLPNVLFVDSHERFSSYELIQRSKFVMVYNSTIGLEAAIMGAPVLVGGRARFTQLPTAYFPQSPEEFRSQAEEFLRAEKIQPPAEFQRNARRFLYYQLYRTSLPFGDFLVEDSVWKGYVALRPFAWKALLAENSPTLKTVVDGVLKGTSFLLPE